MVGFWSNVSVCWKGRGGVGGKIGYKTEGGIIFLYF